MAGGIQRRGRTGRPARTRLDRRPRSKRQRHDGNGQSDVHPLACRVDVTTPKAYNLTTVETTAPFNSPGSIGNFEPALATAAESADAIRRKSISATELLSLTFRRVDLHNPTINAIVWQAASIHKAASMTMTLLCAAECESFRALCRWIN